MAEPDPETLERRLEAVERAVADGNLPQDSDSGAGSPHAESVARLDELEDRVDQLDAALQAVRGFLGGVDAVNESVERRAEAAVAAVERLERRLEGGETPPEAERDSPTETTATETDTRESVEATPDSSVGRRLRERW